MATRHPSDKPDWDFHVPVIKTESDRGTVLVAAAMIDECLFDLLTASLVDDKKVLRRLVEYPGPCSSLAARTDLAFSVGLIGKDIYEDIRSITRLRNALAHEHGKASFDNQEMTDRCNNLNVIQRMMKRGTTFHNSIKDRFCFAVIIIVAKLEWATQKAKRLSEGPTYNEIILPDKNFLGY